jgi:outer membrane PBP1 activator LpoA protein
MSRRALHIWSLLWSITWLLYGGIPAGASEAPSTEAQQPSTAAPAAPHIALLLPTGSEAFAKAAQAVRTGFMDASKKEPGRLLAVRLYPISDDPQSAIDGYVQAVAAGARMVVGPLTRNGVTALATQREVLSVPTLALNVPEALLVYPSNLYTLSLHVEAEARQVAQLALRDGRRRALTITEQTSLGRRMRDAFVDEFELAGGSHVGDHAYDPDSASLERIRQSAGAGDPEMVFLAVDAPRARIIRPHISALPAYGTSQINPGIDAVIGFIDLGDVRFIDMPWALQPDHPAVSTYLRDAPRAANDLERLRALGIDAFRVAQELLADKRDFEIDGVTGRLTLEPDGQVKRALLVALIASGKLTVIGETRP